MQPGIQYAKSGDVHVAYQVVGEGAADLVIVPGWVSHLEVLWEEPQAAAFLRRLGEFSRVILFDKRGTGMSDPLTYAPPLDERMDDIRVVMDAAGSDRAALFGYSEGGPLALMFAAMHPERTSAVIAYGSFARWRQSAEYPIGVSEVWLEAFFEGARKAGITGDGYDTIVPSRHGDEEFRRWFARMARLSASPGMMELYLRANLSIDINHVLPSIQTPTLVLHRVDDQICRVDGGRYLAAHIPGAKYVELPGGDHWPWFGDTDAVVEEVEELLTGTRHAAPTDRVLATVMFTDIVGSTEHTVALGDSAWKRLLEQHDSVTRRQVERYRGRIVKHTGDGTLATFDGPARAVQCASAIQEGTRAIGVEVRVGLHVGECERRGDDIGGIAVHIAARVMGEAQHGEILVSSTVRDLVGGSGIRLEDRGLHELRGIPDPWRLFAATV